jgi:hypothetical protein
MDSAAFHDSLIDWLWIAWALYWGAAAAGTKATKRREEYDRYCVEVSALIPLLF